MIVSTLSPWPVGHIKLNLILLNRVWHFSNFSSSKTVYCSQALRTDKAYVDFCNCLPENSIVKSARLSYSHAKCQLKVASLFEYGYA